MTQYPVAYHYDRRDGGIHCGFASTAEQALALAASSWDEPPQRAELDTCEVGTTCRTRHEFEGYWRDEINEGWVYAHQVYGGWIGMATYWRIE